MLALRDLQQIVRDAVLTGDDGTLASVIAGDGLSSGARIAIYRNHVFNSLTEVLKATYPVVCRLVSERFFAYAADQYIRSHPPGAPCLFEYGETFPGFLERFPPCRELTYLSDVARLEWAMNLALHAEDTAPIDPAALRHVAGAETPWLRFRLHPSLSLLASPWPIDRIWHANQSDSDPELVVDLGAGGACLEVRRSGDDAIFRPLDAAVYALRHAIRDGRCLEDAAAEALAVDGAFDLAAALHGLLADGVIVDFEVSASPKATT